MANPDPAAQAAMAAALNDHDRIRRSTELPLFFGRKERDSISARLLIDRVNTAAQIGAWNEARKLNEFYMILRDRALMWWNSLDDTDVDKANWNAVKADFLASYEARFTAKTTCTNFHDLVQRQGEGCHDYYLRVHEAFTKMCEAKPAALANVRAAAGAAVEDVKAEGIRDIERFFKHQLFLAGLKDDLRVKVMEAGKDSLHESMRLATELEVIHQEKLKRGGVAAVSSQPHAVTAVSAEVSANDESIDELQEDELAAINAIRFRNGRPPFRGFRRPGPANHNSNSNGKSKVICRYCKKPGHVQKDCFARKEAGAPMVDEKGKPYKCKVHAVSEARDDSPATEKAHHVGAILSNAVNSLNW